MEFVESLFKATGGVSPAGSAGAEVVSNAGGWTTSIAPSADPSPSLALGILQGRYSALSLAMQAGATASSIVQEDNAARAQAEQVRREFLQKRGAARVAFAGSGVDISSGQPVQIEKDLGRQRRFEMRMIDGNRAMRIWSAALKGGAGIFKTAEDQRIDIAARG
jgi:hypothetical protein